LGSLWDQEQCAQFCSKDELWEAAKEEEMKIPWKEAQEGMVQKVIRLALRITWGALSLRARSPAVAFVASGIVRATDTKSAIFALSLCDYTPRG